MSKAFINKKMFKIYILFFLYILLFSTDITENI